MMVAKSRKRRIGLRDRLGRLSLHGVYKLVGEDARERMRAAARLTIDIADGVKLTGDTLHVRMVDPELGHNSVARVTMVEMTSKPKGLHFECDRCPGICDHVTATFSMLLEDKLTLGLSAAPDPADPLEMLTEAELLQRAYAERAERASIEKMRVKSLSPKRPWSDYTVTSYVSGKTYRVSLRGTEPGESYCSCPDFRSNCLGTCKHILHVLGKVQRKFSAAALARPYKRRNLSLRIDYLGEIGLRWNLPSDMPSEMAKILGKSRDETQRNVSDVMKKLRSLERAGFSVHVYPDADAFIEQRLTQESLAEVAAEIRKAPEKHSLRKELLSVELLPYQMDGIAFAVGAGRAILADDMGLGKTIQGIGVAELFAQLAGIRRVLVVCPATLKSQWRNEIAKFSGRSSQIVVGSAQERVAQYNSDCFFTICNYEQVVRDQAVIEAAQWDLIILDEAQRIKNWESKTSRVMKGLRSRFALVLTGTPLENRLEELFNVVSFVDDRRLGPAYRFLHRHRVVDENGRVQGYQSLDELRERLQPILLRRTRASVMRELPERTTEIVRITPTQEQFEISDANVAAAARIAAKKFLTEMDLLRLQQHLLMARMAADSTFLVNKEEPSYSSKLECLDGLLQQLLDEPDRKIVLFSEWTTMLNLIEPLIAKHGGQFVRLDGKVPQQKRQQLVHQFQTDPNCRVILMSNAGTTGLNLQAANTVINVDLPWNPAVLEQRVARAHRMGQRQPVHVYLLVTEQTIEERMLGTLSAKHDLAMAALDVNSNVDMVELRSGIEELRSRLERLIGKVPPAPIDASEQLRVEADAQALVAKRERVAAASGELLGAALSLVGELIDTGSVPNPEVVDQVQTGLASLAERDAEGRLQLRLTLKDDGQLRNLAQTLAKLLVTGGE
jgi:superfamily II DNA or RNA helicase